MRGRYDAHIHTDYCEVLAVIDGEGSQAVSSHGGPWASAPLARRSMYFLRPVDRHALTGSGARGMLFYNVAFPLPQWESFVALANLRDDWMAVPQVPSIAIGEGDAILVPFQEALRRFGDRPTMVDLIAFLSAVTPHFFGQGSLVDGRDDSPTWLRNAYSAMEEEENLQAGFARLLDIAHVSGAHLTRTTRRYYGVTPTRMIADLRLRCAERLLASTLTPMRDIAARCGYSSQSHFSRAFRTSNGMTPGAWRRRGEGLVGQRSGSEYQVLASKAPPI